MNYDEALKEIWYYGFATLSDGVFLWGQSDIIDEQKTWNDSDASKHFDFTKSNFWITTDSGTTPIGFESIEEALEYINKK